MSRFKIIEKQILSSSGLPGQLETEFRTWDDRSAIYGLGLRANPGNITHLSVSGRTLDELSGILGDPPETVGSGDMVEATLVPASEKDPNGRSYVLTGLGFSVTGKDPPEGHHRKDCHMAGMRIYVVDISRGFGTGAQTSPQIQSVGTGGAPTRVYMVGSGVEQEAVLTVNHRLLATKVTTRAHPGNVSKAWSEWGAIVHGSEVGAGGLLAALQVRVDSQRVDLALVSGDPLNWHFDLDESLSTQMLLLSHAREAVVHSTRVNLFGVKWDDDPSAELEMIELLRT